MRSLIEMMIINPMITMRTIVKYRLGQALVQLASDTVMFFCCESGGERISRHNALRDALFDTAVAAGLGPTILILMT